MNRRLALAAAPLALLAACSSGGGSSSPSTVTQTVATTSSAESETSAPSESYPTPPDDATATEPTGLDANLTTEQRDNFQSFRLTMNAVVPKSYGLSDTNMVGLAAYICSQAQTGQPKSVIELAVPGVVKRLDASQPEWDENDAAKAVDKAEVIYCEDEWSAD